MIWEEGISVIVMLTRLNENNLRMCHCYWPTAATNSSCSKQKSTNKDPSGGDTESLSSSSDSASSQGSLVGRSCAQQRRGSVTSVFNASTRQQNCGPPIIGNGELNDNMLTFDITTGNKSSFEEEEQDEEEGEDTGASTSGARQKSQVKVESASIRFEVHLVSEHVSSGDYLVRNIYLINRTSGESRTITQFHYLAWPHSSVPENAKSLLQFRRKVHKSYRNLKSPILVHSGDGSGRSGTYTLIDLILERIKNGSKEIDPLATLEHLRDQRIGLCSTQSQFEFVLVALAEEIQIILNALPQ